MTKKTLQVGCPVFYTGDQANHSGWLAVSRVQIVPGVGECYDLLEGLPPQGEEPREFKGVYGWNIGDVYKGHCNPRFVTADAYRAYEQERVAAFDRVPA